MVGLVSGSGVVFVEGSVSCGASEAGFTVSIRHCCERFKLSHCGASGSIPGCTVICPT